MANGQNEYTERWTSVGAVRAANASNGGRWFEPGALRFFKSRIGDCIIGGRFFVSSEKDPDEVRRYSIRAVADDGSIDTVGDFQGWRTAASAKSAARKLPAWPAPFALDYMGRIVQPAARGGAQAREGAHGGRGRGECAVGPRVARGGDGGSGRADPRGDGVIPIDNRSNDARDLEHRVRNVIPPSCQDEAAEMINEVINEWAESDPAGTDDMKALELDERIEDVFAMYDEDDDA